MILITGATGKVGGLLTPLLKERELKVRVLTRDRRRAEWLKSPGVEIVEGDLYKPETLLKPLKSVDKVFLLSPMTDRFAEGEKNLVDAAVKAGVKHIVKLSVFEANLRDVLLARLHRESEKYIEQSGLDWTFLRPMYFMQNIAMYAPSILSDGKFYLPAEKAKISMIDTRDIAEVAAEVLTGKGHEHVGYDLSGPEILSFTDVAERLTRLLGKKIEYISPPKDVARKGMISSGVPVWLADAFIELFDGFIKGYGNRISDDVEKVLGRNPINFDRFLEDNRAWFVPREARKAA